MLDMVTGELLGAPLLGHTCRIASLAISRNGNRIVSVSEDGAVWVWDAGVGRMLIAPLEGHTDHISKFTHYLISLVSKMTNFDNFK